MKKITAAVLCAVMMLQMLAVCASAENKNDDPIILVSGFLCSQLFKDYGTDSEEKVWVMKADKITDSIGSDLRRFFKGFASLAAGDTEKFGISLGEGAGEVLEDLRCNPDGSSAYNVTHYPNDPATSSVAYMIENGLEKKMYEVNFCKHLAGLADASEIYCFQYDSRLDAVTLAGSLNEFIEEVKAYTGSEKVRIFCLSFGGLITSSYLYIYGDSSVSKLIMSVPALGGTNIPDKLFRGDIDFPVEDIASFFETILGGQSDASRLFEASEFNAMNAVFSSAGDGMCEPLKYWGSIWSLCSADLYDELKADFLDPVLNKVLIEKTDKVHYEIMPAIPQMLRNAQTHGIEVAILCGTGSGIVTGGSLNGDVILPAGAVSGATCAPLGQRFADGYKGVKTSCSDPAHNHISPSMEVDASSAYLPENTWFIEKQYHGQYYYEEYTRSLVTKLLLTDEIKDIYSSPDYPQFEYSNHSTRNIHVKFDSSSTGYLSSEDNSLIVKNVSENNIIKILSVHFDGAQLDFDVSDSGFLKAGESAAIPFEGEIPSVGPSASELTVSYVEIGSINPFCVGEFDVQINNGDSAAVQTFASAKRESRLEAAINKKLYDFIVSISAREFVECIYNFAIKLFK